MESSERFSQKHIVIFSILVGAIFVAVFGYLLPIALRTVIHPLFLSIPSMDYVLSSITNFIAFAFLMILIKNIGLYDDISWNFKGISKGLVLGFTFIIFTVLQMYLIAISAPDKTIVIRIIPLINSVIYCISIGLWEETLCRGLLLTNMLKKWGQSKRGIIKSILLSSVIFGALHLISLINNPGILVSSLTQVMYATIMGILISVIYIKTKSLWSAIVLHFILNFAVYSMPYIMPFSAGMNQEWFLIILILFNLLWLVFSYFLIIKLKVEDVNDLFIRE